MKRFHISLSVADLDQSIRDYSRRLATTPHTIVTDTYAMWRTDHLNFSVVRDPEHAGQMRNLGFEDDAAPELSREVDTNGVAWERFSSMTQDLTITLRFGIPAYIGREEELIRN